MTNLNLLGTAAKITVGLKDVIYIKANHFRSENYILGDLKWDNQVFDNHLFELFGLNSEHNLNFHTLPKLCHTEMCTSNMQM